MAIEIKTIGNSGQISLGKEHAGRTVTVEQVERGVWVVKTARVVPDNETWLHRPDVRDAIDRASDWAENHPPKASNLAMLSRKLSKPRR